mgnify:CR=1 FL=1
MLFRSILPDVTGSEVAIYFYYKKEVEKIYSDYHLANDDVELEFELENGGYIEVVFNDDLGLKQRVQLNGR